MVVVVCRILPTGSEPHWILWPDDAAGLDEVAGKSILIQFKQSALYSIVLVLVLSTILKNKKLPVSFRCFVPNIYWYILTVHFSFLCWL